MKKTIFASQLFLFFLLAALTSIGQITNTETTISLANPSAGGCPSPAAGNYTLSITYFDLNTGTSTPITTYNAIVSYNGTTIIITIPTPSFPTIATAGYDFTGTTGNFSIGSAGPYFFDNGQYSCSALPVTLTSWNATVTEVNGLKQINFTWTTESESNSCYYIIEWAPISNQVWQGGICKVPAAGESSQTINYSFLWLYPQAVDYLFRLKMVDKDGNFKYSLIIRKPISCSNGTSSCYRTPGNCSYTINGPSSLSICSSDDYTLSSNGTTGIIWSLSSSLASQNNSYICNSNSTRVSANTNGATGTVTLNAQVNGCSNTISKAIQITCGTNLSISGSTNLCSGTSTSIYSINNLPCNSSVSWTSSNTNVATISAAGNPATLTAINNGSTTITATINACNGTTIISKAIYIGSPFIGGTYFSNNQELPLGIWFGDPFDYNDACNLQNTTTNMQIIGSTSVTWSKITSNPSNISWSQNGNNLNFYFWGLGQTAVFRIQATNSCGSSSYDFGFKSIDCSGGGGGGCYQYQVAPNPAQSSVRVVVPNIIPPCDMASASSKPIANLSISEVRIYDQQGFLKTLQKFSRVKTAQINLNGLNSGLYFIEIIDGQYKERQQILIQH
jgi:Secretion system C-terminal sorting domain/Bacterial Ig-like domain (group 2)